MSPQIDLAVVLTNPYMLDSIDVLRRMQIMNDFGEAKMSIDIEAAVPAIVYPEGMNELSRRPEAQTNNKSIVAFTRFALRGESKSSDDGKQYQPDVIRWRGSHFLVIRVEDYSNFALGFVKATATSMTMIDQAPVTKN